MRKLPTPYQHRRVETTNREAGTPRLTLATPVCLGGGVVEVAVGVDVSSSLG
jgi:hypothetical protein